MAFEIIYSRLFLEKVLAWPLSMRQMAFGAAEHAALDPHLNDYKRPYLRPHLQKHPGSNHQYTLYFEIVSIQEIFISWINDSSCMHDTRNHHTDPCFKEFERLRNRAKIESYDPDFHKPIFEVIPDRVKPIRCRSKYLGHEVILNTAKTGDKEYIGHAFFCSEPDEEIAGLHVRDFLNRLHQLLTQNKIEFQFQFTKSGHGGDIDLLSDAYDVNKWAVVEDDEDFILKKI